VGREELADRIKNNPVTDLGHGIFDHM
jgi:hypothetical protein